MNIIIHQLTNIVYQAKRAIYLHHGHDSDNIPDFESAPNEVKAGTLNEIVFVLENPKAGPEELHEYRRKGWIESQKKRISEALSGEDLPLQEDDFFGPYAEIPKIEAEVYEVTIAIIRCFKVAQPTMKLVEDETP
jgi:hypothetical protein